MKLKEFLDLYSQWNKIVCINDDNLDLIVKGIPANVLSYGNVFDMEVVCFGIYDDELSVRVK